MDKAHDAPRCTARSKRSGQRCRAPAVRGWRVCRMHGARGGAPEGQRNGELSPWREDEGSNRAEKVHSKAGQQIALAILNILYVLHGVDAYFELTTPYKIMTTPS